MDTNQPNSVQPVAEVGKKKSKKGLIIGIISGGGALIIAGVVILLIVLLSGLSKADYRSALEVAVEARTPYSKLSSIYIGSYSTEDQIKKSVDTINTNREAFDGDLKKLGEMKAVKKDKEAKELFDKLTASQASLNEYLDAVTEYYEVIHPVASELSKVSISDKDQAITALKSFQVKLAALDAKQKINKDYLDTINEVLPKFISAIEAYANMTSYDSSLYRNVSDLSTKLTNADKDWKSNLTKLYDSADSAKAFNNLGNYLTDKANGK